MVISLYFGHLSLLFGYHVLIYCHALLQFCVTNVSILQTQHSDSSSSSILGETYHQSPFYPGKITFGGAAGCRREVSRKLHMAKRYQVRWYSFLGLSSNTCKSKTLINIQPNGFALFVNRSASFHPEGKDRKHCYKRPLYMYNTSITALHYFTCLKVPSLLMALTNGMILKLIIAQYRLLMEFFKVP